MQCGESERLLYEYLDGVLPPEETQALEAHLATCEHCAALLEECRRALAAVGELHPECPDIFAAAQPRLAAAKAVPASRSHRWVRYAASAAAVVLLVAAGYFLHVSGQDANIAAPMEFSNTTEEAGSTPFSAAGAGDAYDAPAYTGQSIEDAAEGERGASSADAAAKSRTQQEECAPAEAAPAEAAPEESSAPESFAPAESASTSGGSGSMNFPAAAGDAAIVSGDDRIPLPANWIYSFADGLCSDGMRYTFAQCAELLADSIPVSAPFSIELGDAGSVAHSSYTLYTESGNALYTRRSDFQLPEAPGKYICLFEICWVNDTAYDAYQYYFKFEM